MGNGNDETRLKLCGSVFDGLYQYFRRKKP